MINTLIYTVLLLGILTFVGRNLYKVRNNSIKLLTSVVLLAILVVTLPIGYGIFREKGVFSNLSEESQAYVINFNETKSISGTTVSLKKVFLDLMQIQGTYTVSGKEKLVAIELKKKPEDVESINVMTGLWEGRRVFPQHGMFGMSYNEYGFINPVYIVFCLSNGESISFEVSDRKGVKDRVKVIKLNKTIKYDDNLMVFTRINKGLNYSLLLFESNFMPTNIEVTVDDGTASSSSKPNWSGGGERYSGGVGFDPIKSEKLTVKVKDKVSKKEEVFVVNVK